MEYERLFEKLHQANIKTLICGGLAVNIYGIPRMTADIDLLVDFEKSNLEKFEKALKDLSYLPVIPIPISELSEKTKRNKLVQEKNLIAYSFYNSRANYMNVDVLIDPPFSFEDLWLKRETRKAEGFDVHLVSVQHLIDMKTFANRKQDQDDVVLLSKLFPKK